MSNQTQAPDVPRFRYTPELAREIEARWQAYWEQHSTFRAVNPGEPGFRPEQPKLYALDMFPYPSGQGLHVGHPLGYTATDIFARYKRMCGFNVLHAMGFDAFGLPAEQYAIETGTHPRVTTDANIERFRAQIRRLGFDHEPRRGVSTTDIEFYKWTQWIFLQIYNAWFDQDQNRARPISELIAEVESGARRTGPQDKPWARMSGPEREHFVNGHRLAYLADVDVNWCPALGTVLANEEVTAEGRSERGNHPVFKRPMRQWMMRITTYADRLLEDLEPLDWPESIKLMQRNWIGRSRGAFVDFPAGRRQIRVFTTRPDTLFGATYMVLAPEHPLVDELTADHYGDTVPGVWLGRFPGARELVAKDASPQELVAAYRAYARAKSDVERQAESKEKTGVFIGAYAVNPVNEERIPIFIADYVLMGYGTGAIMAVPAHDTRDYEFATEFELPIRDVVYNDTQLGTRYCAEHRDRIISKGGEWRDWVASFEVLRAKEGAGADQFDALMDRLTAMDKPLVDGSDLFGGRVESLEELASVIRRARLLRRGGEASTGEGVAVNSPVIDGLPTAQAKVHIIEWLEEKGFGTGAVTYKLRDWLFSRQRYWGEPFPIVYDASDTEHEFPIALPESALPVTLPDIDDYTPKTSDDPDAPPQPPLGRAEDWARVMLDLGEGMRAYERELNTMPQWAGSCWYYLRYLDPENTGALVAPDVERYWMLSRKDGESIDVATERFEPARHHIGGVDLYVGGVEHAVLHLLYARFWHKVLFDLGHVSTPEPFGKLFNQGYIQAPAFTDSRGVYVPAHDVVEEPSGSSTFFYEGQPVRREYGKMGKSLKNVITPDEVCDEYSADTMRLYEMYMGPLEQSKPWNPRDIVGVYRFLQRVWRNLIDEDTGASRVAEGEPDDETSRLLHRTIEGVRRDLDTLGFNTAIAKLIELNNHLAKLTNEQGKSVPHSVARSLVLMLAPFAPHMGEELWRRLGFASSPESSLACEPFPEADPALLVEDEIELPVQIMGKVKGRITIPADADEELVRERVLSDPKIAAAIEGRTIQRVIIVPGRMVNIVAN